MATRAELPPTARFPVLGVRIGMQDGCAVLSPHGEIDHGSVAALNEALDELPVGVLNVVVNMAEVTFIDSAGVHFLSRLRAFGRRRGILVEAIHFGPQPRHILEVDGSYPLDAVDPPEPASGSLPGPGTAFAWNPVPSRALHLVPAPAPEPTEWSQPRDDDVERMREEIVHLRQALGSRTIIDQARGMIMALGPCASWSAWDLLVEVSRHCNVEIRDVAAALVATTAGQPLGEELEHEIERAFQELRSPGP